MRYTEEILFLGPLSSWESNILGRVQTLDASSVWTTYAHVYYCPVCGAVWGGRIPCTPDRETRFMYCDRYCQQHGDGSLMSLHDKLESIPPAIAQYEICVFNPDIHSRFYK